MFNSGFLLLADHYDFLPRACRPRRARTKVKVERMVKYLKGELLRPLSQVRQASLMLTSNWSNGWLMWLTNGSFASSDRPQNSASRSSRNICSRCLIRTSIPATSTSAMSLGQLYRGWRQSLQRSRNAVGQPVSIRISLDDELRIYSTSSRWHHTGSVQHHLAGKRCRNIMPFLAAGQHGGASSTECV